MFVFVSSAKGTLRHAKTLFEILSFSIAFAMTFGKEGLKASRDTGRR
jgi:hypothetical protein